MTHTDMTFTDLTEPQDRMITHTDARPDDATRLDLYRMMVRMRSFEERAYKLFMRGLVKGTSHLGIGMEAIAAGAAVVMRPDDWTFCTYRGHNHTLGRGAPMAALLGELMGRENGICGGKGGGRCT